jgi:dihydroflavonol-4-reductase
MTTLLTGGTGFLGRHVVEFLLSRHESVRVLSRRPSAPLSDLGVAVVPGDVLDRASVEAAFDGVTRVVHMAGRVHLGPRDTDDLFRLHVEGTTNVLASAARAKVSRFVHVSTSGTIAASDHPEPIPDETFPYATEVVRLWPYYLSKIFAEKCVLEAFEPGLSTGAIEAARVRVPVVIVSPSLLLGPGDDGLSSSLEVVRFLRREIPAIPSGGVNFVDVRDAAAAIGAALEKGRPGERYLVGGPNMSLEAFFLLLEKVSGVPAPTFAVPRRAQNLTARALHSLEATFGLDRTEAEAFDRGSKFWYLNPSKARAELGFVPRSAEVTLRDAVDWLRARGSLPRTDGILARAMRGLGRASARR